jgi:hypothetical protein
MRFPVVASLSVTMLIAAGCSDSQSVKGAWDCNTSHPGGFVSSDIFDFSDKGTMTLDSDGMVLHGSYTQEGTTLTMHLLDVPIPDPSGRLATQPQTLTATIQKKSSKVLEMDVSTGSDHHLSKCTRN